MSALAAALLLTLAPMQAPAPAQVAAAAPASVASEPLFADIVARAGAMKSKVEAYRASGPGPLAEFEAFKGDIQRLSELDQTGSDTVRARGVDTDLACILQGISLDLRYRLGEVEKAATPAERDAALKEMIYLLRDNVEVILAPPVPTV